MDAADTVACGFGFWRSMEQHGAQQPVPGAWLGWREMLRLRTSRRERNPGTSEKIDACLVQNGAMVRQAKKPQHVQASFVFSPSAGQQASGRASVARQWLDSG